MTTLADLERAKRGAGHSIFSPSSAAMWSTCPGSLVANALADDRASREAAEGTVAHAMADQWLRSGQRPAEQTVVEDGYEIVVDRTMLSYVEMYVDWVQDCRGAMFFEQRVDFSPIMPIAGQTGTADHFSCTFGELTITDLKYGQGVKVFAEGNPQAQLYALGVFYEWDWYYGFESITIRICQPRLDHFDSWTIDRVTLLEFAEWIGERARDAWRVDAPRRPGEKTCQWCAVKRECPAYLNWFAAIAEEAADDVFGVPEMQVIADKASDPFADDVIVLPHLSIDAACRVLTMRGPVEQWFKALEDRVFAAALNGDAPGWKIVEGRSNRKWIDPDHAQARMVEVGFTLAETETRKLLSPNQAEEALQARTHMGKKAARELFEAHTERSDGVRSLVRASDKREALPNHGEVFD